MNTRKCDKMAVMRPKQSSSAPEVKTPADLRKALSENPQADDAWRNLTAIARRDFISWIQTAKQAETRTRRIQRCCENLVKGKRRPCCYAVVPMDFYKALGADPKAKAHWSKLTSMEKRDLTSWIESADDKSDRMERIGRVRAALAAGKHKP